ncbi:hypothetical protein CFOLD11_11630 [Clostridium folliculivorans]|uniref:SAM-dependent methyltransferase n=1 Tax=Clostridium folliculivorans TaxID=2886038 RepID=A0A9W5Y0H8_9CLOT|nr:NAD(P)-dependent oxidoreductase [Clostridium folliculivorans]GKU24337.1 hypothetical protein CFOLD11_11630 [Clostridium folliculivorans]
MSKLAIYYRVKPGDCYETPKWAVDCLLRREAFEGVILEPCCGQGAISKVLKDYGYGVISSDIRDSEQIDGEKGKDIFSINKVFNNIITNPPYSNINDVIKHFSRIYNKKMALLLRLSFLESMSRYEFFTSFPLKVVYVFCARVTMYPEGEERPKNSGSVAYAWFVWDKDYIGNPMIRWIPEKEK